MPDWSPGDEYPFDTDHFYEPERAEFAMEYREWNTHQAALFDNLTEGYGWDNQVAQELFEMGFVDHDVNSADRYTYREALYHFVMDTNGIDIWENYDHDEWAKEFYKSDAA